VNENDESMDSTTDDTGKTRLADPLPAARVTTETIGVDDAVIFVEETDENSADDIHADAIVADVDAANLDAADADAPSVADEDHESVETGGASGTEPPLRTRVEAVMLVVDEPVPEIVLAQILEVTREEVAAALRGLAAEYDEQRRGFDLREVAGGWRFYTRAECASVVERFVRDGQQARLTQAALETLAVVAYRQPVSRSRVSAVRGVNCDGVMRTLVARGLVEEAGTDQESNALLYRTTPYFLERMGLRGLDELPDIAPLLPDLDTLEAEDLA
jgi:segregation and condensation protein B